MSEEFTPPTPGPKHDLLKPFEGTFKSEVKMWFGPGDPMVTTGVMVNSWQVGNLYLYQDYKGDASDGPFPNFEGKGYWGYNPQAECYEGFWIDNASSIMQTESGSVDDSGKVWTMLSEVPNPMGEGTVKRRTVITLIDDSTHKMETYNTMPQGEMKTMEINYVRA